jgi:hypothetical protein
MKKTIEEIRAAVIAELVAIRDETGYRGVKRLEWLSVEVVKFDMLSVCVFDKPYAIKLDGDIDPILLRLLYSGLGLEARDAVEAEREEMMKTVDALSAMVSVDPVAFADLEAKSDKLVEALEEIAHHYGYFYANGDGEHEGRGGEKVFTPVGKMIQSALADHKEGAQND